MKLLSILIIAASGLMAEDAVPTSLTDKQVIEYLKSILDSTQKQLNACKAPETVQAAINKLAESCGKNPLTLSPDGVTPMCAPPPAVPAAAPATPAKAAK